MVSAAVKSGRFGSAGGELECPRWTWPLRASQSREEKGEEMAVSKAIRNFERNRRPGR